MLINDGFNKHTSTLFSVQNKTLYSIINFNLFFQAFFSNRTTRKQQKIKSVWLKTFW